MRDIVETCDVTRNEAGGPQENLNATEGNDDLTIVTTENGLGTTLFALGGDDTITDYSSGGSNIYGGEGNDVIVQSAAGWNGSLLSGGSGNDDITGGSHSTINGGEGNDTLNGFVGGYNQSSTLEYHDANQSIEDVVAVTVDFSNGTATDNWGDSDVVSNFGNVIGTMKGDTFIGSSSQNQISYTGLAGSDTVIGAAEVWNTVEYRSDEYNGGTEGIDVDLAAGARMLASM